MVYGLFDIILDTIIDIQLSIFLANLEIGHVGGARLIADSMASVIRSASMMA